jgi:transposase
MSESLRGPLERLMPLEAGFEHWMTHEFEDSGEPCVIAIYRLESGLACSFWLAQRGNTWVVEGLYLFPESRNVAVGPRRRTGQLDTADLAAVTDSEPPPITARLLRELRIGEVEQDLRERIVQSYYFTTYRREEIAQIKDQPRKRKDDAFYAELASEYVRLLDRGKTSRPVKELAGRYDIPERTIYRQVNEARRRGLLSQTTPGKAGGYLTARAEQLLLEMKERE